MTSHNKTTMPALETIGRQAKHAALLMAQLSTTQKNSALLAAADALMDSCQIIIGNNRLDVAKAKQDGMSNTLVDRLTLTEARIKTMAEGLRKIVLLPDPVEECFEEWQRPNGLEIRKVRVPIGVIAVIYEARPNVTSDVIGLCLKSGNASILRGSASALNSNYSIVNVMTPTLTAAGIPLHATQLINDSSRQTAQELMRLRKYVDLLIPRGGAILIQQIISDATVPYIIDGDGNCHVYVDKRANLDKALNIVMNAKVSRPSVCNSAEKLLVHKDLAEEFLPKICVQLKSAGVELRGDEISQRIVPDLNNITEEDWGTEYLDLCMAIKVVNDLDEAIEHIQLYSSGHTEAIVTEDKTVARKFISAIPPAVVMVNASTRFTDGEEFGFGAEIGNSTQRLHARGPMGLRELTTYRYEVWGNGQIRG